MRSHQTLLCLFVIVTSMKNISLKKHCVNHCSLFCLLILKEYFGRDQKLDENHLEPVNVWETVRNCFCWRLCVKNCHLHQLADGPPTVGLNILWLWVCAERAHVQNQCPTDVPSRKPPLECLFYVTVTQIIKFCWLRKQRLAYHAVIYMISLQMKYSCYFFPFFFYFYISYDLLSLEHTLSQICSGQIRVVYGVKQIIQIR